MIFLSVLLMAAPVPSEAAVTTSADPTGKCVMDKALRYSKRPELADALAQVIASECAEILPQTSDKDCGAAQARCDAIVEETNVQIRAVMVRYAYRAIVTVRQNR